MLGTVVKGLAAALVAMLLTALGTVWHRFAIGLGPIKSLPIGLILGCLVILAGTVVLRAWAGWPAVLGAALGAMVLSQILALPTRGGGVLVHADALGYIWVFAPPVMALAAAAIPRRFFRQSLEPTE